MTAPETPGQAAYEAACGWEAGHDEPLLLKPWGALGDLERDCWHRVAHAAIAAQEPKPAPGSLRADLEETLASWRGDAVYRPTDTRDEMSEHVGVTACADTLAGILADHPAAGPEPELVKVRAELSEIADNHAQLLEAILQNADEDTNGGDEAAEYLAEQYVRWLEAGREQLLSDARERELAKPAPELPCTVYEDEWPDPENPVTGRTPGDAAPELRAAMAETRQIRELLDDFTRAVIDYRGTFPAITDAAKSVRKKAGLPPVEGK